MSEPESTRRDTLLAEIEHAMQDLVARQLGTRAGGMVAEQLASGGKRIRPRIAVAAAEALGVPRAAAIAWGAAIELLHNATLVHDDVQDGDRFRRDKPTLWARHGAAQAINAGDALLMLPFIALEGIASPERGALASALASHAVETVRGQISEIDLLPAERLEWASYVEAATGKTGALFALPVVGIAILAGAGEAEAREVGEPLRRFGVAFQIQDDVMDLYGDKGRESPGSDLREGKVSALVVAHLERRPEDRRWLLDVLRAPRDATPQASIDRAAAAFRESGALTLALDRARMLRAAAERAPAWTERPRLVSALARVLDGCGPATDVALRGVA